VDDRVAINVLDTGRDALLELLFRSHPYRKFFSASARPLIIRPHYGGVTKTSDAHRAVAGDEPIDGHALLEN
jgi:hypothetical protein